MHICCLHFRVCTFQVEQVQILQISEAVLAISVFKLKADGEAELFLACFELDGFSHTSAVLEWLLSLLRLGASNSGAQPFQAVCCSKPKAGAVVFQGAGSGDEERKKHVSLAPSQ